MGILFLYIGCTSHTATQEFEIEGPCENCPLTRLDSVLKTIKGIKDYTIDGKQKKMILKYDSLALPTKKLIEALNAAGYNIGEDFAISGDYGDACCENIPELMHNEEEAAEAQISNELEKLAAEFHAELVNDLSQELVIEEPAIQREVEEEKLVDEESAEKMFEKEK
ncbi:MAG: heavy metal-associated domain-containing protein [Bacteroidia bacterium]|nr:heavy-metal-associated domain-containing protein [Bacteroidia bacterium]MDW8157277.1 heavy metal-associated domain-containing protein [Bacteroidia bacterium]